MSTPRIEPRIEGELHVVGAHAEGEVGNVVIDGVGPVPGETMAAKSAYMERHMDHVRRTLLFEPRGGPTHAANVIFPSRHPDADMGFVLLQVGKYSTMSGNNLICVATVLLERGILPMSEPETVVTLETPAGLIEATCRCVNGKVEDVEFRNAPCFVAHTGTTVEVEGVGTVEVDVAYGGVMYALVDSGKLGFALTIDETPDICWTGRKIRAACNEQLSVTHPENPAISGVPSVVFAGPLSYRDGIAEARNATVINRGRVDRCACGTGTCARLALLYAEGRISLDQAFHSYSVTGSRFVARVVGESVVGGRPAVVPTLRGRAWITGTMRFSVAPDDPIASGRTLPDVWN